MEMRTLESQWIIYRDACYPPKNGKLDPLQESETRQAFFAGCLTVLEFLWPWEFAYWKPCCENNRGGRIKRMRELTKAGALIAAEIDRLQRLG